MSAEPLADRQRWATAVGRPLGEIASVPTPLLRRGEPIAIVGGALAAALVHPIRDAGFEIVAAEARHSLLDGIPDEAPEYEAFGNGYGEIHSARAFRQLVERALRTFAPKEDRWYAGGRVVDPFRPNLRYTASSDQEFDVLAERHLNTVRSAFRRARVVLVALANSEIWEALADGAVFPHWAEGGDRHFDADNHRVRMLTVEESVADLEAAAAALRELNPGLEIVLMVSPEPQPATALPVHVLAAATLGKAVLRIAAETATRTDGVHYFPALEIASLHAADPRGAVPAAVAGAVAEALMEVSEGGPVSYGGSSSAIPVVRGDAPPAEPTATEKPAIPNTKPSRPTGVQAAAEDAYTKAAAAQKAEKDRLRAAKRAKRAPLAEIADAPLSKHDQKVAEREARKKAKAAERAAKAEAPKGEDSAAIARAQKLAERKAWLAAKIATRDAKRAAKSEPEAEPKAATADATPTPRRARARKAAAPPTEPTPPVVVEPAPTPIRKERRARRVKPATETAAPSSTSGAAVAAPARAKRVRRARKPKA